MFGRQKPMTERPANEPKFNKNSRTDRLLVKYLILLMGGVLLLIIAAILIAVFVFGY